MTTPIRIGGVQLTLEPLDGMLASAQALGEASMDTIWLADGAPMVGASTRCRVSVGDRRVRVSLSRR